MPQPIPFLLKHEDPQVREAAMLLQKLAERRASVMGHLRSAVEDLRLDMKYLMFDLETTRRERDELREKLQ